MIYSLVGELKLNVFPHFSSVKIEMRSLKIKFEIWNHLGLHFKF